MIIVFLLFSSSPNASRTHAPPEAKLCIIIVVIIIIIIVITIVRCSRGKRVVGSARGTRLMSIREQRRLRQIAYPLIPRSLKSDRIVLERGRKNSRSLRGRLGRMA